jgi:AraC-like DNA-binding protein
MIYRAELQSNEIGSRIYAEAMVNAPAVSLLRLLQGKVSLAEIVIACDFSHQSHLNRHFKHLTGVTPKTFLNS